MNLSSLLPPVGWIVAVVSAAASGLWLQRNADALATINNGPEPVQTSLSDGDTFYKLPPLSDQENAIEAFAARPLLAEGRRPFVPVPEPSLATEEPEPAPAPPVPEEPSIETPILPDLVMLGTIRTGEVQRVLILDPASGLESWQGVGDSVQGWAIVDIQPETVTLTQDGVEITFNQFQDTLP